jgi:hypothetical protein
MYDETNVPGPEYKVRPVVRYAVTAYYHPYQSRDGGHACAGSSRVLCECDSERSAELLAHAMTKAG